MGSCWYCLTEPAYSGTSTLLLLAQSLQVCFIEFSLDVFQFTALPGQRSYFSRLSAFRPSSFIFALSVDIKSTALGEDTIWIWMRWHALLPYYMKTRTKRAAEWLQEALQNSCKEAGYSSRKFWLFGAALWSRLKAISSALAAVERTHKNAVSAAK